MAIAILRAPLMAALRTDVLGGADTSTAYAHAVAVAIAGARLHVAERALEELIAFTMRHRFKDALAVTAAVGATVWVNGNSIVGLKQLKRRGELVRRELVSTSPGLVYGSLNALRCISGRCCCGVRRGFGGPCLAFCVLEECRLLQHVCSPQKAI